MTQEIKTLRLEIAPWAKQTAEFKDTLAKQTAATAEIKDTLAKQTAAIEGIMDQLDMSEASSKGSRDLFNFKEIQSDPPMVPKDDPRVEGLVQVLRLLRSQNSQNFDTDVEKLCRDNCIIPFFQAVAKVYGASTIEPNLSKYQLKVLLGRKWFHGYTDLFVGGEEALVNKEKGELILMIEMKPITGSLKLKGSRFQDENYRFRAQIALQGAAIQSCCTGSIPFSCILTNLDNMYVLQVTSYNSFQITAQTFTCVSDESKFVRAVLKAADTNKKIQKHHDANRQSIMCVTNLRYDSHTSSLALGVVPHVQGSAQGADTVGAASHEAGKALDAVDGFDMFETDEALDVADGFCTPDDVSVGGQDSDSMILATPDEPEPCTWSFAKFLALDELPRHHDKTSFTKTWVHMVQEQQPLADCSSQLNNSNCTQVCPSTTIGVGQA